MATFSASEGTDEGQLIGDLASGLLRETPAEDLYVFTALADNVLIGAIFFSRLRFDGDPRTVFVLAPVAVKTDQQGQGVGQRLLSFGLEALRGEGVDIALTYGDPNYYSKVGFRQITETDVPAPFTLNHPEGWLGQSLTDQPLGSVTGPSRCVAALNDPAFW